MILDGTNIKAMLSQDLIIAYRGNPEVKLTQDDLQIGPNSVDVTLGDSILAPTSDCGVIDPRDPESLKYYEMAKVKTPNGIAYLIMPGLVYLGFAAERFEVPGMMKVGPTLMHLVQMLDGRSTVGRIGIAVHVTAGFGDVGFGGNFTLEIVNFNRVPVLLYPGMRIGQVAFHCVTASSKQMTYNGAYKNDHIGRPVPPVLGPHRF